MKTMTQSDLLKQANEISRQLVVRLREFNSLHDAEVEPHLDLWQLGGRLQESLITFLARRHEIEVPEGERNAAKEAVGAATKEAVGARRY